MGEPGKHNPKGIRAMLLKILFLYSLLTWAAIFAMDSDKALELADGTTMEKVWFLVLALGSFLVPVCLALGVFLL